MLRVVASDFTLRPEVPTPCGMNAMWAAPSVSALQLSTTLQMLIKGVFSETEEEYSVKASVIFEVLWLS